MASGPSPAYSPFPLFVGWNYNRVRGAYHPVKHTAFDLDEELWDNGEPRGRNSPFVLGTPRVMPHDVVAFAC
jgi:hypothetical protein